MPLMPVVLWTDALLYLLLALLGGFAWHAARHEHLRAPWRRVARSRIGVVTLVVLGCYLLVAVLDSVHLRLRLADQSGATSAETRYSPEVLSLLDLALAGLRSQSEKTYSAPFATHLYVKEAIELPDGRVLRDYPRLVHGGAHLDDPAARGLDILWRGLLGALLGLALWGAILFALSAALARRRGITPALMRARIKAGRTEVPWRAALLTLASILALGGAVALLAGHYHVLGTDKVGEDVLYQALKSVRTGLLIGTLTTLVMLPAALLLGIMAGYFRGWVDDLIQYLYTTLNAIPGVLLIAAAVLMLQVYMSNHAEDFASLVERADLRLLFLCLILGVTSWTGLCRLLRGETLKLRESDYVQAASALGVGHFTIIGRHILPNVMHIVLITLVLDFSGLVLAEAVLSYVNIGVDPTMNSWGNMINGARLELAREPVVWWSLSAAFVFMFTLVLAANLFADVVRDAFDPRLRGAA
ncbi:MULTISPECIES: ABC transporter permease [Marichromatium]|uniref:Peptide/nickel transport system permease protein n=1 Tax=Marichromatium gracile TaxID=1048 RepID=A0A4R4A6T0_MARGR|nr:MULTISPECIES: ABC transporter permease [Marichromatium]MBK1708573.1 peptide ABC transporter permease [Marichromatium gracile]RNE89178.1 ABC transporter permease [Marichromatium sp. AB31]RNE93521.1 ABC transporter permease [Marichromatium sp. AB32]TCW34498.1 peptide/nickel transport system permease protein [Marichromatium gracile]